MSEPTATDPGAGSGTSRRSTQTPARPVDGSAVPARLRIVGWIVLATLLGLAAVVITIRSALITDVDRGANAEVVQEVDEFRTFVERGRDPETGGAFSSPGRLLQLHLERQYPGGGQALVGYDGAAAAAGRSPLLLQGVEDRLGLSRDPDLLRRLAEDPAVSGVVTGPRGDELRWGKARVQATGGEPGGAFLVLESTRRDLEEVDRIVRLVVLVCLGGLLLTAGIAWAVAGQILAPVRQVRRAASRITRADLSRRIDVRGRDDVAALAVTFNAMLDRLESAFTAQQRFSATAGAHLQEPLQVLRRSVGDEPEARRALDRTAVILADLELLAASETPGFVQPAPVELSALTDEVLEDARRSGSRRWQVEQRAEGSAVLDATRVREALRRLTRNAEQHVGSGGTLLLGSRLVDDAVELYVKDDGPGLSDEDAARVLGRSADAAPSTTGPGLGLAVVRAVADAHDGSAWVETELGHGAVFGLSLPLRRLPEELPTPYEMTEARVPAEATA